ncbi:MAG: hypothetical protein ACKVKF_07110 [Rhodobacterales bacterium]
MSCMLEISFFGTCTVRVTSPAPFEVKGVKHRALFALLATAPMGRRTRSFLQETLWGAADYDAGHQNLRRALTDLRKLLGPAFEQLFSVSTTDIELNRDRLQFQSVPPDGPFLDDLNIRTPAFLAWRDGIRADPGAVASLCGAVRPRPRGRFLPRIAALPLFVPDGDPELRVLADWVAEEMTRMLSRSSILSVISHLSCRAMAKRLLDVVEIRATLDIDYLCAGTLRRAGGEIICDFDFVDAETCVFMWNRNLSCPEGAFLRELPARIEHTVRSIGRSIAEATVGLARQTALPHMPDHRLVLTGVALMHRPTLRDFMAARGYLSEAALRAPDAADVHAWLGKWHALNVFKGYTTDRAGDTAAALACTARALDLDPESSFGLTVDGFIHGNVMARMDIAEVRYGAAQEINPNESLSWLLRGALMAFRDDGQAAIEATRRARLLSPIDPFGYYFDSIAATAHLAAGNWQTALDLAETSMKSNDRHISTLRSRITALHQLDRGEDARVAAEDLKRRFPNFTLDEYRRMHPSAHNRTGRIVIDALSASGIS